QGALGLAFQRRQPVVADEAAGWGGPGPDTVAAGLRAAVAVPLLLGDRAVGTLAVGFRSAPSLPPEPARVLALLAALVAPALAVRRCQAEAERSREEARHETAQMSAILEQMADVVLVVDRQGRITLANPAAAEMFGLPVEQLIGLTPD